MKSNNVYVNNISLQNTISIIDGNDRSSTQIVKNIVITGIIMLTMAQITISARPENAEYVDKLASYKDIKKKFVTSQVGRTLAAATGIAASYPYLMQDPQMKENDAEKIRQIICDMVDMPSPNIRRIKPSIAEWQQYAKGEAGSAMGQIISCPSTNLKTINVDPNVTTYGIREAISALGISNELLSKHNITPATVVLEMRSIYLVDKAGLPIERLEYDEPTSIFSKIQKEVLNENLIRTGTINSNLVTGLEPEAAITRAQIEKHLNPRELIAYNFAINTGDKNILKKYTETVKKRAKAPSEPKPGTSSEVKSVQEMQDAFESAAIANLIKAIDSKDSLEVTFETP